MNYGFTMVQREKRDRTEASSGRMDGWVDSWMEGRNSDFFSVKSEAPSSTEQEEEGDQMEVSKVMV